MVGGAVRLQEVILGTLYATVPSCFNAPGAYRFAILASPLGFSWGYNWTPKLTGTWKTALKYARFNLVDGRLLRYAGYDFDNSPMIEQRGEREAQSLVTVLKRTHSWTY